MNAKLDRLDFEPVSSKWLFESVNRIELIAMQILNGKWAHRWFVLKFLDFAKHFSFSFYRSSTLWNFYHQLSLPLRLSPPTKFVSKFLGLENQLKEFFFMGFKVNALPFSQNFLCLSDTQIFNGEFSNEKEILLVSLL